MADEGHEATEALIGEVSERVRREYVAAYEEAEEKLADYLRRFEAKDRIHAEAVRRGEETEADYREWRRGQILVGRRWQELVDTLAEDYRNADRVAASIVSEYMPDAYAINHDYATFQVERGSNLDTSYTLYDRAAVERLIRDQPDLLPAVEVDGRKDLAWNRRHIVSAITQGVLQGEPMDRVARRVRSVADMDYRASMRTARTAVTSAQNAGRVDAYRRAQGMGIRVRKQWLATLDQRTRHSHRRLDGEVVGMEESFSNGLRYPGDPESGRGSEVYNCRCTLVPVIDGADQSSAPRNSKLGGMSYEEWKSYGVRNPPSTQYEKRVGRVNYFSNQDDADSIRNLLLESGKYKFTDVLKLGDDIGALRDAADGIYREAWEACDAVRSKYSLSGTAEEMTRYLRDVPSDDVPGTLNRASTFQRYSLLKLSGDMPDVVDGLPGSGIAAYRAVGSAKGLSAATIHDMTRYDRDPFVGGGIFGDGIYFSSSKAGAEVYGASETGSVMYAEIKKSAKMVEYDELQRMKSEAGQVGADDSVFAAEAGYDVIYKKVDRNEEEEVYYCVLKRSALTIRK